MNPLPIEPACEETQGLRVAGLYKSYLGFAALQDVSFKVAEQEIVALLGPSGCGKSTTLALIAGLEKPDRGEICWNGASLTNLPIHRRDFGLMFQDFALFPHQNVFDNVAYGLRMKQVEKIALQERVEEVLELVGLPKFQQRDVNTLSGGEMQRVALARSLAPRPRLLMLDEPLGALDRTLRERLLMDLNQILADHRQTAIYVTHDQEEAFALADRVVLMNAGRIVQDDTPQNLYRQPKNTFIARFLGLDNLIPGQIFPDSNRWRVETSLGTFYLQKLPAQIQTDTPANIQLLLRPDQIFTDSRGSFSIQGQVQQVSFRGSIRRVYVRVGTQSLRFDFQSSMVLPEIGQEISLSLNPEQAIQVFEE